MTCEQAAVSSKRGKPKLRNIPAQRAQSWQRVLSVKKLSLGAFGVLGASNHFIGGKMLNGLIASIAKKGWEQLTPHTSQLTSSRAAHTSLLTAHYCWRKR